MDTTRLAAIAALSIASTLGAAAQSYLSQYDVIVSNNLGTSTDIRGLVVAKNYTGTAGGPMAQDLGATAPGTDTTFVQSSIASSGNSLTIQYGSLAYGGASISGRTIQFNQAGNTVHFNSSFNFAAVFTGIATESSTYAAMAANSTAALAGNVLTFTLGNTLPASGGIAVFNVDAGTLGNAGISQYDLALNGKAPSSIIVNIIGSSFARPGGANFTGNFTTQGWFQKTLWNFSGATTVDYGAGWKGSILAPSASVTSTGDLDGSLAALNATLQGEVHLPMWTGTGTAVPEPSTYAAGAAMAMLVGATWLRSRRAAKA